MMTLVIGQPPPELAALLERRRRAGVDRRDEVWRGIRCRWMTRLDPDVGAAVGAGVAAIADPAERERVREFLRLLKANRASVSVAGCEAIAMAARTTRS